MNRTHTPYNLDVSRETSAILAGMCIVAVESSKIAMMRLIKKKIPYREDGVTIFNLGKEILEAADLQANPIREMSKSILECDKAVARIKSSLAEIYAIAGNLRLYPNERENNEFIDMHEKLIEDGVGKIVDNTHVLLGKIVKHRNFLSCGIIEAERQIAGW